MSDFLSNLAARNLGSVPAIRPRVASCFEPVHENAFSSQGLIEHIKVDQGSWIAADSDAKVLPPAATTNIQQPKLSSSSFNVASDGTEEKALEPETSERAPHSAGPRIRPKDVVSVPEATKGEEVPSTVSTLQENHPGLHPRHSTGEPREFSDVTVREVRPLPAQARPEDESPELSGADLRLESGNAVPRLVSANGARPSRTKMPNAPNIANDVRDHPWVGSALPNDRGKSSATMTIETSPGRSSDGLAARRRAEPEPSINVTIGRVEVRAEILGATSPRVGRKDSPVMSLDKYLLQRTQRGGE